MATIEIMEGQDRPRVRPAMARTRVRTALLVCGILSSVLYAAMVVFVAIQWEGYSSASQAVSELSAIGAPTRPLWVLLGTVYSVLVTAFGLGVWMTSGRNHRLRVVGGLIIASGFIGFFWPPMHLRGAEMTLTDILHIVFSMAWLLLALLTIGFGAAALGKRFRLYSLATLAVFVVFGTLTGLDAPRLAANLPTPWLGVWERINIGAYLLWVVVLAVALLRGSRYGGRDSTAVGEGTQDEPDGVAGPGVQSGVTCGVRGDACSLRRLSQCWDVTSSATVRASRARAYAGSIAIAWRYSRTASGTRPRRSSRPPRL